jgi:aspartate kinase
MKFGGTSVGNAQCILGVADIIKSCEDRNPVVVVSAMAGVTDQLVAIVELLKEKQYDTVLEKIEHIELTHITTLTRICDSQKCKIDLYHHVTTVIHELKTYLHYVKDKDITPEISDYIVTFGERLSARIVAEACNMKGVHSQPMDSSRLIVTDDEFGNAKALLARTQKQVEFILVPLVEKGIVPIVTGFFGKTRDGKIATLGRGGSDYVASILAYAAEAEEIIIWKEVDGVYTKDPNKFDDAEFIPELSYNKAAQMARAGAKVLHKETMEPAKKKKIPIWVRNTFQPDGKGTRIGE